MTKQTDYNACYDQPDERDYEYEMLLGGEKQSRRVDFPYDDFVIQDQFKHEDTHMACTRYGLTHIHNAQQILEGVNNLVEGRNVWIEHLRHNPSAKKVGSSLQSSLKQFKDMGLINGYFKCNSIEACRDAIDKGYYILTGSPYWDGGYVKKHREYRNRLIDDFLGHCVCWINRYKFGFIGINSNGEENGFFNINNEYFSDWYTKYAIIDKPDTILSYKKKIMKNINIDSAKKAYELGIWNGKEPTKSATREETFAGDNRVIEYMDKKFKELEEQNKQLVNEIEYLKDVNKNT